jgi:Dipeptidyl aminopeptidases/acylaminoacyl-peptidases
MKTYKSFIIITLAVVLCSILNSCDNFDSIQAKVTSTDTSTVTDMSDTETDAETQAVEMPVNSVEEFANIPGVTSVSKYDLPEYPEFTAYDMKLNSEGYNIAVYWSLPADYQSTYYPTLIYFPEVGMTHELLAYYFNFMAESLGFKNINVICIYARGFKDSEGTRDLWGDTICDAQALLSLCERASFIDKYRVFAIGSSEGSIGALRLTQLDKKGLIAGCAVINTLTDLHKLCIARGEDIIDLCDYLIGGTYEEVPKEYERRSAVYFADQLNVPILIMAYTQQPLCPIDQAQSLKDALVDNGKDCTYYEIDELNSDFCSINAIKELFTWIDAIR